jgi:hypothetical protein
MDERDFADIERLMKKMVCQIADHNVEEQIKKQFSVSKNNLLSVAKMKRCKDRQESPRQWSVMRIKNLDTHTLKEKVLLPLKKQIKAGSTLTLQTTLPR